MIIVWWALHLLFCKTLINLHSCKYLQKEQSLEKADANKYKDLSFLLVPIPKMYNLWTQKKFSYSTCELLQKKWLHLKADMKSQFPGYWVVGLTLFQGHHCGSVGNKFPHSLPEALILQAPAPWVSLPPPLQDVQDNQIRAPKGRTTWIRAKFTWLHWEGTIRVKYHFVQRASHRNQTRSTKGMLNIQIYSNFPLITIHIFTYFNILVRTKGMCMYIYFSGEDSVPCFPLKLLADLKWAAL